MNADDLVKRLRERATDLEILNKVETITAKLCKDAADAIEAKDREIDALEKQIEGFRKERSENEAEIERLRRKAGE